VKNAQAYYCAEAITVVKSFVGLAAGPKYLVCAALKCKFVSMRRQKMSLHFETLSGPRRKFTTWDPSHKTFVALKKYSSLKSGLAYFED
jgi:hypothetical protein